MSESQGYKLGMKLGLSDKSALFAKIRRDGSKREVELLMEKGEANTAFRRGLKSAAVELSKGKRRPAARKKTTRQRLTTAKRPAAKRKRTSSSRTSYQEDRSMFKDWNQKETTKWFATLGEKIGNFKVWDSWVYAVVDQPVELRASYASGSLEDPGMVWEITQVKGQPAVLTGQESGRGRSVERYTGTLAQMKKKLASISRRKRKNPSKWQRFLQTARAIEDGQYPTPDSPPKSKSKSKKGRLARLRAVRGKDGRMRYYGYRGKQGQRRYVQLTKSEYTKRIAEKRALKKGLRKRKNPRGRDSMGRFV